MALASAAARAGVTVDLPAGERAEDWGPALALAGLEWTDGGSDVVITGAGPVWVVRVSGRDATVAAPHTAEQREDLVWLVASLVTEVQAPAPVVAPEPAPEPAPRPRPDPPPRPPPDPADLAPDGLPWDARPVGIPDPIRSTTPPAPRPAPSTAGGSTRPARPPRDPLLPSPPEPHDGPRPWASVAGTGGMRVGLPAGWRATATAGAAVGDVGVGAGAGVAGAIVLPGVGGARTVGGIEVLAHGWFAPPPGRLDAQLGAEIRRFREAGELVQVGAMPFLRVGAGLGVYLGRGLWLEPSLAYRRDLGATQIRVDGVPALTLPSGTVEATIGVGWR